MVLFVAPSAISCSTACSRELSRTESGLGEARSWPSRNSAMGAGIGNSRSSRRARSARSIDTERSSSRKNPSTGSPTATTRCAASLSRNINTIRVGGLVGRPVAASSSAAEVPPRIAIALVAELPARYVHAIGSELNPFRSAAQCIAWSIFTRPSLMTSRSSHTTMARIVLASPGRRVVAVVRVILGL